jgi:RimJ/RimL family protein N-acetyltransferase
MRDSGHVPPIDVSGPPGTVWPVTEGPTLHTDRLLLRRWRDEDRGPFAAINADPVVMEHFQRPMDRDESDAFVDRIEAHFEAAGWGLWAVEVPGVAPFVGYVGLWPAEYVAPGTIEVGWRLAASSWGHGYAPEAAAESLRFAFEDLGRDEMVSFTVPQNTNSRRVMEKIGLRRAPDRDFDHPRVDPAVHPHLVRHVLYAIGSAEWRATQAPGAASPRK